MHGERPETMPQEIVDALEFILSRITWDHAQERLGVSRQTIMSIERGRTNPSILLAYKIATALNVDVNEVFFMEGKLAPV